MSFLRIERVFNKTYRVKFIGSNEELYNFLKVVVHDKFVYFNFFNRCWEIREEDLDDFLMLYNNMDISIERRTAAMQDYEKSLEHIGNSMKLKPYMYQREAIKFSLEKENALIILPCGSGNNTIIQVITTRKYYSKECYYEKI